MTVQTIFTSKDASAIQATTFNWSGSDLHHPVGRMFGGTYLARSAIYFPISFAAVTTVTSAILHIRGSKTGASHCYGDTSSKTLRVRRALKTWGEDTPETEGLWGNRTWDYTELQATSVTHEATLVLASGVTDGTWYTVDVTDIVKDWKSGLLNLGLVLFNNNEADYQDGIEFYSREKGSAYAPYLVLTTGSNTAPNAPTGLHPTGDATVASLKPVFTGTFSDPDAGDSMLGFQIQLYADNGTTLIWDTSLVTATTSSFSRTYSGPTLSYNTFYKWRGRTADHTGLWGPYSSLQRFQTVNSTPPPIITGLSATILTNSIDIDWDISTLANADFDHYELYRREFGDTEWTELSSIFVKTSLIFHDLAVSFGVIYEYKITQFKNVGGGFDIESEDSDIVAAALDGEALDVWMVVGADGTPEHTFELPVTQHRHVEPIQQEVFEPLGSQRKTVVRGKVLGAEGSLAVIWDESERDDILPKLRYITHNRGPHTLRSPFGDVWLVEFGGPEKSYQPVGHLEVQLTWTEVA